MYSKRLLRTVIDLWDCVGLHTPIVSIKRTVMPFRKRAGGEISTKFRTRIQFPPRDT